MFEDTVVGDMVARTLADALVSFTGKAEDIDAQFLLHFAADRMDIVADKAYRTGREYGDGLGLEVVVGFLDGLLEFFLATENNFLVLHVRGEAIGHEVVAIGSAVRIGLVATGQPAVVATADGAVGDVDDVPGGA
jgi:hypothetical protein